MSEPISSSRLSGPLSWPFLALAFLIALGLAAASRFVDLPDLVRAPDAWSYDLRTSLFSPRVPALRDDITVIVIDDDSLSEGYPSRSPVDRGLLATLVRGLSAAGAKAIGLDIIVDRTTTPAADAALMSALHDTKDVPVVLGALDARTKFESPRPMEVQERFLADAGRTAAHLYFARQGARLAIGDQIVRYGLGPSPYPPHRKGFAEALAEAAGRPPAKPAGDTPQLIAWQRPPASGGHDHPFRVLRVKPHKPGAPIGEVLWDGWENEIKGRIVLVGGAFEDMDQHLTPLAATNKQTLPGVIVHGQILGQLLDGREVPVSPALADILMLILAAVAGMLAGARWRWQSGNFQVWFIGGFAVLLIGIAAFWGLGLIIPSGALYVAWVAGVWVANPPPWALRLRAAIFGKLGLQERGTT